MVVSIDESVNAADIVTGSTVDSDMFILDDWITILVFSPFTQKTIARKLDKTILGEPARLLYDQSENRRDGA